MVCGSFALSGVSLPYDAARRWHRGEIDGIDVISLPLPYSNRDSLLRRSLVFLKFAWRSSVLALREEYDVLFATSTPLTAAIPGIVMKLGAKRRPFVFEVRDLWPELPRALGMKNPFALGGMSLLEWLGYRAADGCIGLSPGIVEGIRRRGPKQQPVALIPNGCDLELFHPSKRSVVSIPGVEPGDFVAGFTGAHGIANGLDAVLDAAGVLQRQEHRGIKIVLIGDGNQKDRLKRRARDEGLANVIFADPVKKTEIARLTASFDCGLMILANVPAFYYGTSPNKFFDYLAAGVPVINNYPGWLADLIQANGCGVAVPPESPEQLADALVLLAEEPERRAQMGQQARALGEREFARETLAARFVAEMESLVCAAAQTHHGFGRP